MMILVLRGWKDVKACDELGLVRCRRQQHFCARATSARSHVYFKDFVFAAGRADGNVVIWVQLRYGRGRSGVREQSAGGSSIMSP